MPETTLNNITIEKLEEASVAVIKAAGDRTLWCFEGEMGAGKTTLIQNICRTLGVRDDITSPTFSLVNEYRTSTGKIIYHFDFYRIRSLEEVYDIGYEDYFYSGHICLIEWPSNISDLLAGEPVLTVNIHKTEDQSRTITVS